MVGVIVWGVNGFRVGVVVVVFIVVFFLDFRVFWVVLDFRILVFVEL